MLALFGKESTIIEKLQPMTQSILNGFLIFSVIQALLFLGLLMSKKHRYLADFMMMLWLFVFSLHSLLILVNLNVDTTPVLRILPVNLTLLYGPILFCYVKMLWVSNGRFENVLFFHSIPFVLFFLLTFVFFENTDFQQILSMSGGVSGILYCVLTLFYIRQHERKIIDLYSTTKSVSLDWLKKLIIGVVFVWSGIFVLIVIKQLFQVNINLNWFFILIPFFITYIGYYGLKQKIIFQTDLNITSEVKNMSDNNIPVNQSLSYEKSGLSELDMKNIFNALENLMKTEKLYLEPGLNLKELANKAQIPQHHITQTLNRFVEQNFYDYINAYRVNEFINKLKKGDADNFSLLGIAFDCGFNSKSTFNRIFKKSTGFTPSEYKKRVL